MTHPVRKAVFPVGGLGTRFLPATKSLPKEMLPVVDKPLIQYAVEEARASGIEEIIFVTGRGKTAIEDHFDHSFELESILAQRRKYEVLDELKSLLPDEGHISYTRQGSPMGLGHAIWCARELVADEPFAVLLADDLIQTDTPCLKQMLDAHAHVGGYMVAMMDVEKDQTHKYGIIDPGEEDGDLTNIVGLIEKPTPKDAPSNKAIIGRYILQPDIFNYLANQKKGAGGEIQLTDALEKAVGKHPFFGFSFKGRRFDCGDKAGYINANISFALQQNDIADDIKAHMKEILSKL